MAHDHETSRPPSLHDQASLCSVAVLHGINCCVMNSAMRTRLHLEYDTTAEPTKDIGISSNNWHVMRPQGPYRRLRSVLLRRMPDTTPIAVANPVC